MPEASTDPTVENVLSSIRRLIEQSRTPGDPPSRDPLLLSPALRAGGAEPGPLILRNALPMDGPAGEAPAASLAPGSSADRSDPPPVPAAAPAPDEAELRSLVAQAVREELQGELGERLTRNLRKLVRHEVMQALAMRDLR